MLPRRLVLGCCLAFAGVAALPLPAPAQSAPPSGDVEARIETLIGAVVRVRARALDDARSNATLGRGREGSGIVIDDAGHILTIGYLVIEPDAIEVTTAAGRTVPALLAGYDHASGFGLLKAQAPLNVKPLPLGASASMKEGDPVMVLPYGGRDAASMARIVSTRRFSGSWEYLLDRALFTSPPNMTWSGAALVNRELALVGVGSLIVQNAMTPTDYLPGNMFVPIDLLQPILADLKEKGRAAGPARPGGARGPSRGDARLARKPRRRGRHPSRRCGGGHRRRRREDPRRTVRPAVEDRPRRHGCAAAHPIGCQYA
jgi:serine protease Do